MSILEAIRKKEQERLITERRTQISEAIEAISREGLAISYDRLAQRVGTCFGVVYRFVNKHPELLAAMQECRRTQYKKCTA